MSKKKYMPCDDCRFRRASKKDPTSLLAWFWEWHTKWCPGWKAYLKALKERGEEPPQMGSRRGIFPEED